MNVFYTSDVLELFFILHWVLMMFIIKLIAISLGLGIFLFDHN